MRETASNRIEMLRFPLIVGVVLIHNYSTTAHQNPTGSGSLWFEFAHRVISEGIARVAVPLFYLISGYLFFIGFNGYSDYRKKLARRVSTLLIPYIFWNLLALWVYGFGEWFKPTSRLFSSSARFYVPGFHAFDYVNALLGITARPIAYQFWFIRDLMALVLLAPVIRFVFMRKMGLPLLLILFGCWYAGIWPAPWPAAEGTLFFWVGAYLCYVRADLSIFDKSGKVLVPLFLVLLACDATYFGRAADVYVHHAMVLLGVLSCWWLTGMIAGQHQKTGRMLSALGASSFFVFAAHEPLLTIMWKLGLRLAPHENGVAFLAMYLCIPTALIVFLVFAHRMLERVAPRFTAAIAGGRSQRHTSMTPTAVSV
jgi:surface polysaccharide O-acyltransferase-like enzyme